MSGRERTYFEYYWNEFAAVGITLRRCRTATPTAPPTLPALMRIEELLTLRDELGLLISEWDGRLSVTAKGERADLLESLGKRPVIEGSRRQRLKMAAGVDDPASTKRVRF